VAGSAKTPDLPLKAGDLLFIPNSAARSIAARTAGAAVQVATMRPVSRRPSPIPEIRSRIEDFGR